MSPKNACKLVNTLLCTYHRFLFTRLSETRRAFILHKKKVLNKLQEKFGPGFMPNSRILRAYDET